MKKSNLHLIAGCVLAGLLAPALDCAGQTIYNQSATNNLATGTNLVEKSATTLDVATFRTAAATAWTNDSGGVFDLPTSVATGTTVYRANYGINHSKRMQVTSSVSMQNSTSGGNTFYPISNPNVTTSSANQSDFTMTLGLYDINTGLPLTDEALQKVGFVVVSRTSANYPLDLTVTATFSDGSTQAVTATIAGGRGLDDTFFGFQAPTGQAINSVRLQSFVPGTQTPVADRLAWDDFGFVTGPSFIVPQPQIVNVSPAAYAILNATNGIHFNALTYAAVDKTNIALVVNSIDVSSQLVVAGDPTNFSVAYNGLVPDQQYDVTINVTNSGGVATLSRTFYTYTTPQVLYDSQSFTNDTLYPIGALQPVMAGRSTWAPNASEPADIIDVGDPHGKVLRRLDTGASRADFLNIPPVSSGTLVIEFDAQATTTNARTMDLCVQPATAGTTMAGFIAWGEVPGKISYFDNVNWLPFADSPIDWHHVKMIQYLSGPAAGKYDVLIDGNEAGQKLPYRNAAVGTAFSLFRIQSANTAQLFDYGLIDNLVITAGPADLNAYPPPTISNVSPFANAVIRPSDGIHFQVTSQAALAASNIVLLLNSTDVSSQLVVTGSGTNLLAAYTNLVANQTYSMQITVTQDTLSTTYTNQFYVYTNEFVLYDSGGFTDDTLYPLGSLGMVTNGTAYWAPAVIPSQIVDSEDPQYGKVLRRAQSGPDEVDVLWFSPIASGVMSYSFDVKIPDPMALRTVDFTLETAGNGMASFVMFGTNLLNYIQPGGAWTIGPAVDTNWHHVKLVDHLSGTLSNTYDLYFDGSLVAAGQGWRSTIVPRDNPLTKLRVGAIRGTLDQFGDVDNLIVTAAPESAVVALPVTLLSPAQAGGNFGFSFQSQSGVTHTVQAAPSLSTGVWTNVIAIPGDGSLKTFVHTNPSSSALFYRINSQ